MRHVARTPSAPDLGSLQFVALTSIQKLQDITQNFEVSLCYYLFSESSLQALWRYAALSAPNVAEGKKRYQKCSPNHPQKLFKGRPCGVRGR